MQRAQCNKEKKQTRGKRGDREGNKREKAEQEYSRSSQRLLPQLDKCGSYYMSRGGRMWNPSRVYQ